MSYAAKRQYSIEPERVPKELDSTQGLIYLHTKPVDEIELLFRDIGEGDPLRTKETAHQQLKTLKKLTDICNESRKLLTKK